MNVGEATWPDLGDAVDVVVIPLGSTEQHGPHLALDTDTRIAVAICERVVGNDVVMAPPVAYGASGEHAGFAGTMSIGHEALRLVLVELVRSIDWAMRVVFVNGHGGNLPGVRAAVHQLIDEGHDVKAWSPTIPGGDAHAGRSETSLMLAIAPELVRLDLAEPGVTESIAELLPTLEASGVKAVSANGILGDPAGASAAHGEELLAQLVEDLRTAANL